MVEPVTPDSDAVQVLCTLAAVKVSTPEVLVFWMSEVDVTDPVGPVVPCVVTVIGPEVKKIPGPYLASAVATASVMGTAEPPAGSITRGRGRQSMVFAGGSAHGRTRGGPPKRLIMDK